MRVLVCGSRSFTDEGIITTVLDGLHADASSWNGNMTVIDGAAPGADRIAHEWAVMSEVESERYWADWARHGKAAGPIRNKRMLEESKPDCVWAFIDKRLEDSRGTNDMVQRALDAGIATVVVRQM